eukprot:1133939-Pyramimonas_sp.AAC.1
MPFTVCEFGFVAGVSPTCGATPPKDPALGPLVHLLDEQPVSGGEQGDPADVDSDIMDDMSHDWKDHDKKMGGGPGGSAVASADDPWVAPRSSAPAAPPEGHPR